MKQLTPEQIKTLEDAFASYPEDNKPVSDGRLNSMNGIQQQLDELDGKPGTIFYILIIDGSGEDATFSIEKMKVGENKSTPNPTTECVAKEPTESQIRKRIELTQESYYTARENLREEAYGTTHSKPPGQSWGDYWKSY